MVERGGIPVFEGKETNRPVEAESAAVSVETEAKPSVIPEPQSRTEVVDNFPVESSGTIGPKVEHQHSVASEPEPEFDLSGLLAESDLIKIQDKIGGVAEGNIDVPE